MSDLLSVLTGDSFDVPFKLTAIEEDRSHRKIHDLCQGKEFKSNGNNITFEINSNNQNIFTREERSGIE